ncbi:PVC-type heme-binding CxxCH protein [Candidatus Laterigemmans baculatus]|uniref:PVC-type heme-binding CxxCH protein n=1 Tax=Candidatus Laterigemmans baculatus TaxID=2770505 RepID=UPI0013D95C90|nr:PVC-type heme-binding CxxCH protein [Candidatus Laterigemmans baculatus]
MNLTGLAQRLCRAFYLGLAFCLGLLFATAVTAPPSLCLAAAPDTSQPLALRDRQRIALVGNSLAERMNLFGHFETRLHLRHPDKQLLVRNFGWPADEVGVQQRPGNYTEIDDTLKVFGPDLFLCFFGFNESFAGTQPAQLQAFQDQYRKWMADATEKWAGEGATPRFVLISPIAFESSGNPLQPSGAAENRNLAAYTRAIEELAAAENLPFVDLFAPTQALFAAEPGLQFTINGVHLNQQGDREVGRLLDSALSAQAEEVVAEEAEFEQVRKAVNDKSWLHLQDYRMLNGWYVYGGRRTWDTETFPKEFHKIRNMVAVRDRYVWDLAAGRPVPDEPDDSNTGDVFIPETMFGTRDEAFRKMREPTTLEYPTPEESIAQMTVPDGFEVKLFASEREFPELANPTQIDFDNRGRLWVACMPSYPQWLPGTSPPSDRLLILEDTDDDGLADKRTVFYDKLVCPTGFEFWNGGVLVVDEPRILFLKDNDGDDVADEVVHLIDGIGTDDTHHAMGAWEFSHGGLLHTLEGIAMSTTLETPWGPFRNAGPSGSYVIDPLTLKVRHFRTPAYGNPWCLVFDSWGNGIIGDGTGATHHWTTPLSGAAVDSRKTLKPIFDNEGMRPAVGNDFLTSRHFPKEIHDHFIYGCVINMHGFPRFTIRDEENGAGLVGERIDDLLSSTDMFFRPVDPKIGPDGALWFGDWCNALIGHMQYSQRDPNRDHEHGRVYRLVYKPNPLLEPVTQAGESLPALLEQLRAYEPRTRYRARRELRDRDRAEVLAAVSDWIQGVDDSQQLCEAMWIQESFRAVEPALLDRIAASDDYHARAAAVHTIGNEHQRIADSLQRLSAAVGDPHPRVRVEALRALSFLGTAEAAEVALRVGEQKMDYWTEYTLEHTLQALQPAWQAAERAGTFLTEASDAAKATFRDYKYSTGPGRAIYLPLKTVSNVDASEAERAKALQELASAAGGSAERGRAVFERVCAACHQIGDVGKPFGPQLNDIGQRMSRQKLIESIVWPNEEIAKGYETLMVLTDDGRALTGFVLREDEKTLTLGVANGKTEVVEKAAIELRQEKKASSMPEALTETIAPIEFLDLLQFLTDGWIDTAEPTVGQLRKRGGYEEISRTARIKIGTDFPESLNRDAAYLLSAKPPRQRDFAFHSREGSETAPAITIRLAEPREIQSIWMQNRVNSQFHARAEGLAIWTSTDGNQWQKVWQAPQPAAEYEAELPAGTKAQFIRIGLPQRGILHLNQVVVYGGPGQP